MSQVLLTNSAWDNSHSQMASSGTRLKLTALTPVELIGVELSVAEAGFGIAHALKAKCSRFLSFSSPEPPRLFRIQSLTKKIVGSWKEDGSLFMAVLQ